MNAVFRLLVDDDATAALRRAHDDLSIAAIVVDARQAPVDADAVLSSVAAAPQLTIALLDGAPPLFAARLAAAADIAVASETQAFCAPTSDVRVLSALGARHARRYALTGEHFDAETARRIGLAQYVAMGAQLEATLDLVLARLLARGGAELRRAKAALDAGG